MKSKRVTNYNDVIYLPVNSFGFGGLKGLGDSIKGNMGAISTAAGGIAGSAIGDGYSSQEGNILNAVGDIGGMIPGPWGAVIGGGTKLVGGLVNRAFGTKVNQEALNAANQGTDYLSSFVSNASNLDDVKGPQTVAAVSDAYKGGWFSKDEARRKNAELRRQRLIAQDWANRSVENNIDNLVDDQMDNLLASYAAFGGPLEFGLTPIGGAIDYELAQRRLAQKDLESKKANGGPLKKRKSYDDWYKTVPTDRNDTTSYNLRRAYELAPMSELEAWRTSSTKDLEAGRNHLRSVYKDPKTGIFEFMKSKNHPTINKELDWYNGNTPEAIDFRNQYNLDTSGDYYRYVPKKAFGGPLHTHGADWTNGITIVDNGGTHESNPFEGVPMGIAPDGQPNLVEEGEVIYNDYVFSNRIKVPDAVRQKYKLRGPKEMTFADAVKKAQKESEERPNDPISQRGLEDIMYKLMTEQEVIRESRQQRKYSEGGRIHIAPSKKGTFTAAASKHGMGVQEFASKVLANPEDYSPAMRKKANFARNASKWKHAKGGYLFPAAEQSYTPAKVKTSPLSALRFVPAVGGAIGAFSDLMGWTNKPDYSNADLVLNTANEIRDVSYNPIGDYLKYSPLDRLFYANQLAAQAGATRRGIVNTSGGNRGTAMAGLLAADYNAQNQLGNLYRQAEEYNANQRERVATFNRGTNMFNAENALKAAIASRDNAKVKVNAAAQAAAMREAIDARVGAAKSANLTNLFDSLGDIGREQFSMDMVRNNPAILYDWMGRYKGATRAKGGFLTIKKRRR